MNLDDLNLGPALRGAAEAAAYESLAPHIGRAMARLLGEPGDALLAVQLGAGAESVWLLPLLQWLEAGGETARALVILPSDEDLAPVLAAIGKPSRVAGYEPFSLGRLVDPADEAARLVVASASALASRAALEGHGLDGFGFVVALALRPEAYATMLALVPAMAPKTERRSVVVATRLDPVLRNFAHSFAEEPEELLLESETELAKRVPRSTYRVATEDKPRLALGILSRLTEGPIAFFCNLPSTAEELTRILTARGMRALRLPESASPARKEECLRNAAVGRSIVILTDEGAIGMPQGRFSGLVNYDLPLEGERYTERLSFLDRAARNVRVYNLVCERYSFGLPAIERLLGESLGAVDADLSLFPSPEDAVARASPVAPSPERSQAPARRGEGERGAPGEARGERRRDGRDRPQERRRGEGSKTDMDGAAAAAIRADISAITGQVFDSGPRPGPARNPEAKKSERKSEAPSRRKREATKPAQDGGEKVPEAKTRGKRGTRGARSERGRTPPVDDRKVRGEKPPRNDGQRERRTGELSDPYAVSMEERLKLYREKYGARASGERDRVSEDRRRRGEKRPEQGSQRQRGDSAGGKVPEARRGAQASDGGANGRKPGRKGTQTRKGGATQGQQVVRSERAEPAPKPEKGKGGFLSRLFGKRGDSDARREPAFAAGSRDR